jgi:hypothetical protein
MQTMKRPFSGLDYQGRYPESAPPPTDDSLDCARGIVLAIIIALALWTAALVVVLGVVYG